MSCEAGVKSHRGSERSDGLYATGFNSADQTKSWATVDTSRTKLVPWKLAKVAAVFLGLLDRKSSGHSFQLERWEPALHGGSCYSVFAATRPGSIQCFGRLEECKFVLLDFCQPLAIKISLLFNSKCGESLCLLTVTRNT